MLSSLQLGDMTIPLPLITSITKVPDLVSLLLPFPPPLDFFSNMFLFPVFLGGYAFSHPVILHITDKCDYFSSGLLHWTWCLPFQVASKLHDFIISYSCRVFLCVCLIYSIINYYQIPRLIPILNATAYICYFTLKFLCPGCRCHTQSRIVRWYSSPILLHTVFNRSSCLDS